MKLIDKQQMTGVVLAGGRGRRMGGNDKGLVEIAGKPLIELVLAALAPQVGRLMINANRNKEDYAVFGYPVVSDDLADFQGPLAGFACAMAAANTEFILTVPCDAPRLIPDYAERLGIALTAQGATLAVAHDGNRLQPVHALIRVNLLSDLREFLASGERKIDIWYDRHAMVNADFSDAAEIFVNVNTPAQRDELEQEMRTRA